MIVVSANFGRGEDSDEFVRNLRAVVAAHDDAAVLCFQEIDEADRPHEHSLGEGTLAKFGRHAMAGWSTFEPIVVPWDRFRVVAEHVEVSCPGMPGFTPRRHVVEALVQPLAPKGVPPVWVLNNHAPIHRPETRALVEQNSDTLRDRFQVRWGHGSVIWCADTNDAQFPKLGNGEQTAIHRGPDWIRYAEHPTGASLEVVDTGVIPMTIDNHDALWAQFKVGKP